MRRHVGMFEVPVRGERPGAASPRRPEVLFPHTAEREARIEEYGTRVAQGLGIFEYRRGRGRGRAKNGQGKSVVVCSNCGATRPLAGRGMCRLCYAWWWRRLNDGPLSLLH